MTTQKFENNLFLLEVKTENGESMFEAFLKWKEANKFKGERV